jgi:hypothetical protein
VSSEREGATRALDDRIEHVPVIAHVALLTRLGGTVHDAIEFAVWEFEIADVAAVERYACEVRQTRHSGDGCGWITRQDHELGAEVELCVRVGERFSEPDAEEAGASREERARTACVLPHVA